MSGSVLNTLHLLIHLILTTFVSKYQKYVTPYLQFQNQKGSENSDFHKFGYKIWSELTCDYYIFIFLTWWELFMLFLKK